MQNIEALKEAVVNAEAAYAFALSGVKRATQYDAVVNEGGEGYSSSEALSEAAFKKHAPLIKAAKDALFAATWTRDVFEARRSAWNARAVNCKSYAAVTALEKSIGFTANDMRKAKSLLGL